MLKLHPLGTVPYHIPDHVFRNAFAPCCSVPADCPEDSPFCNIRCRQSSVESALYPDRHGKRADMATFSDEIHDRPVPLSNLDVFLPEGREFCSSKSTGFTLPGSPAALRE
jgi:hypothetical protein